MPTLRETTLTALHARLSALPATALRGEVLPERVPAAGLLILRDGEAPYTHEFQSGSWTLPSMSIETGMPEVPRYAMYSGCVLDQITWQMQRSGLLTATARLVAQGETVGTTTSAGTPAELDLIRFGHFNGAINVANFRGFPHIPGQDAVLRYATKDGGHDGGVL